MYDTSRCYFVTWFFGDNTLLRVEKWGEEGKYLGAILNGCNLITREALVRKNCIRAADQVSIIS